MKEQVDARSKQGRLKPSEGVRAARRLRGGLKEYTYLDCNGQPAVAAAVMPSAAAAKPQRKDREKPADGEGGRGEAEPPGPAPDVTAAPAGGRSD